jgi:5-methylthioadenosine/S-adenosylhomocysteine deaminase
MPAHIDTLFINALVLTMDENFTQYFPGAVAVRGDSIIAVGHAADIKNEFFAQETIDCPCAYDSPPRSCR